MTTNARAGQPTWSNVGRAQLDGLKVTGIAHTGQNTQAVLLVSTLSRGDRGGVYRLDGDTFRQLSGAGGTELPAGAASDLVAAKPGDASNRTFLAAIPGRGIYRTDNAGTSWAPVWQPAQGDPPIGRIRFAAHPTTGVIYAAVLTEHTQQIGNFDVTKTKLTKLLRSPDEGQRWDDLDVLRSAGFPADGLHQLGQGDKHFAMVVDPIDDRRILVGGDASTVVNRGQALVFQGTVAQSNQGTWAWVVRDKDVPHCDSRAMVFSGRDVLEVDDGGIYRLHGPEFLPEPVVSTKVQGTIASSLTTTIEVRGRDAFPTQYPFLIEVSEPGDGPREVMEVTGLTGSRWTVTRGVIGTAASFTSLADVRLVRGALVREELAAQANTLSVRISDNAFLNRLPAQTPFSILVGSEVMSVTARTPGAAARTEAWAVTRENGLRATHAAGEAIPLGFWTPLHGDLVLTEVASVAYDPIFDVVRAGTQDNGSLEQALPGAGGVLSKRWTEVLDGDGNFQRVAVEPGPVVYRYSLANNFASFKRTRVEPGDPGEPPTITVEPVKLAGLNEFDSKVSSYILRPYALNAVQPDWMLIGSGGLYRSQDRGDTLIAVTETGDFTAPPLKVQGRLNVRQILPTKVTADARSTARRSETSRTSLAPT